MQEERGPAPKGDSLQKLNNDKMFGPTDVVQTVVFITSSFDESNIYYHKPNRKGREAKERSTLQSPRAKLDRRH